MRKQELKRQETKLPPLTRATGPIRVEREKPAKTEDKDNEDNGSALPCPTPPYPSPLSPGQSMACLGPGPVPREGELVHKLDFGCKGELTFIMNLTCL